MVIKNKTVLVTGATSGVGYQLVRQLYKDNQVLVISRSGPKLDALREELPKLFVYPADLSRIEELRQLANLIGKEHEGLDLLVNNAAVQYTPSFLSEDFCYDSLCYEVNLNFTSICALCHLLLPLMLRSGEKTLILNVNSGLALTPKTSSAVYCATKAALNSFSQSLAYQLEDTKIKVLQAFLPLVDTPMTEGRGKGKITAEMAAESILSGVCRELVQNDIGKVKLLRLLVRLWPGLAKNIMKRA